MTITETTNETWFSRIGNAFKGILLGIVLIIAAIVLLFWNEGRSVNQYKALREGADLVKTVPSETLDTANEGQLLCVSGMVKTPKVLVDSDFVIEDRALKLKRTVEMYQWIESERHETRKKTGGSTETTTTFSYSTGWSETVIPSAQFKEQGHDNPTAMRWQSREQVAMPITLGAFTLSPDLVARINYYAPYGVSENALTRIRLDASRLDSPKLGTPQADTPKADTPKADTPKADTPKTDTPKTDVPKTDTPKTDAPKADTPKADTPKADTPKADTPKADTPKTDTPKADTPKADTPKTDVPKADASKLKVANGSFYFGDDPTHPAVGDLRITFSVVRPTDITVVAVQRGNTFEPFQAKKGSVELVEAGIVTAEEMFSRAIAANKQLTWILRLVGFLVCFFGVALTLQPLPVVADVLPFVGRIVNLGITFVAALLAVMIALGTIGVAWFLYRPLLGIPMFVGVLVLFLFLLTRLGKRKTKAAHTGST